jgi:hypothetical protein
VQDLGREVNKTVDRPGSGHLGGFEAIFRVSSTVPCALFVFWLGFKSVVEENFRVRGMIGLS